MRKRRAFGSQDVLETTVHSYYLQMSPSAANSKDTDCISTAHAANHTSAEDKKQPKISFSIDSIIGTAT